MLFVLVLLANAGISLAYTKDVIMSPAGYFYAAAFFVACRHYVDSLTLEPLGTRARRLAPGIGTAVMLVLSMTWTIRAVGLHAGLTQTAYKVRQQWAYFDAYIKGKSNVWAAGAWANDNFDSSLSWDDVAWVRKLWPGKLVLKGVLDAEDARRAADLGADAIVVSNHGGRQLDGAPSTIAALPRIADAAGDRLEILFDGGVRSGQDVLKALALGARGCLIGRAYLYGLAAMGEAGVTKALSLIADELRVSMSLTGVRDVGEVSRDILFDNYDGTRRNV